MRFSLLLAFLVATTVQVAWSIPAADRFFTMTQPDGSTIEIRKKGNEHFHYAETRDGQVVERDGKGFFKPAKKDTLKRHLKNLPKPTISGSSTLSKAPAATQSSASKSALLGEKNALIVLVQFADTKFISEDPASDIGRILTEEGYNDDNSVGSAVDYFKDNSLGRFAPAFDIVGPVTISGNNYRDYGSLSKYGDLGAQRALIEALDTLKKWGTVDFKKYDNDGDNVLDYVHMIYAGFGSHDSEQDSAIWPHKWIFTEPKNVGSGGRFTSGPYVIEYACNAERDGLYHTYIPSSKKLFGVGNFIHEFSHLLGLRDMYATNGSNSTFTPSTWDVMDMGAYNTGNRYGPLGTTPPYYSAYERMELGWLDPDSLKISESDTLLGIQQNKALQLKDPENENEFFLLEYRDKNRWDAALPNHGMLIWHIDYVKAVWDSAAINNDESHQYVDIVEADGTSSNDTRSADVFPGTSKKKVTTFNKFITWKDKNLGFELSKIAEANNYTYVTFSVGDLAAASSSSETPAESSSSEVAASSSSETLAESSSSGTLAESSSSGTPADSSSSEADSSSSSLAASSSSAAAESSSEASTSSSSDRETYFVANNRVASPTVNVNGNRLQLGNLPKGVKKIQIFALTGHLLFSKSIQETQLELEIPLFQAPVLLRISEGRKLLHSQQIRQ